MTEDEFIDKELRVNARKVVTLKRLGFRPAICPCTKPTCPGWKWQWWSGIPGDDNGQHSDNSPQYPEESYPRDDPSVP